MYLRTLKIGFVIALLLPCVSARPYAQDSTTSEKRELIKELIELTGGTKNINLMMESMIAQQEKDLPRLLKDITPPIDNLTREERADIDRQVKESSLRAMRRMRDVFLRINYGQMVVDLATPIFGKHFSEPELREWIAFYKSPVGKKSIELMPAMMTEMMSTISESLLPKIQEELNKIIADETQQLTQHAKSVSTQRRQTKPRTRRRH